MGILPFLGFPKSSSGYQRSLETCVMWGIGEHTDRYKHGVQTKPIISGFRDIKLAEEDFIILIFEIVITNSNVGQIRFHERPSFFEKKNFHYTHLRDFVFFDLNLAQIRLVGQKVWK
ncbi:unnamed protein product [Cylicocyclus nassatus]|uniref:Uncharacterized protein n=1 Tax=Cylicocyclus nassatus TaxID=53992 RepID=A0AA36MA38_CYLNA|nr:unnamed protein product [Cylicocyclus nassatus]